MACARTFGLGPKPGIQRERGEVCRAPGRDATGIIGDDGKEEVLSEYLCDYPARPNYASQAIGLSSARGIGLALLLEHARPTPLDEGASD